jgi:cytochrome c biogenesis protein CcmG/thiol:disulfide interchange protein DsbE
MAAPETPPTENRRPRRALPWQAVVAATVLALIAAGLVLAALADGNGDTRAVEATDTVELTPADQVPKGDPLDIEFTDVDGTTSTLRDQLGDAPMVVNFFASWCPPCIGEMPDFEAVSQDLGDRVDFFGLAVTDRPEDASRIVEETGVTYPWSRDIRGDIAGAAEVVQMPTTMFISADGTIEAFHAGAVDQEKLRALIEEHLGVPA